MKVFKLNTEGFKEERRKLLSRMIPICVFIAVAVSYFSYTKADNKLSFELQFLVMLPIMLITLVVLAIRVVNTRKLFWNSYTLTIYGNTLIRSQGNTPNIVITKDEVKGITEFSTGYILIETHNRANQIHIPNSILDREALLEVLPAFAPLERREVSKNIVWIRFGIIIASLIVFLVWQQSTDRIIVVLLGVALLLVLGWNFYETQTSKSVSNSMKMRSYIIFILVFVIVYRILIVLDIVNV